VREGAAMLRSIVEDLASLQRVDEARAIVHPELAALVGPTTPPKKAVIERADGSRARARFDELAASRDWTLVIAPETGGLLEERSRRVLAVGGRLLGSTPEAVALAGDKARLAERLHAFGVPTPPVVAVDLGAPPPPAADLRFPAVLKPRDGAGALHTWRAGSPGELLDAIVAARSEGAPRAMLLSPLAAGTAASASFIVGAAGDGEATALAPGFQKLDEGPRIRYLGGRVPLEPVTLRRRATALARRAVGAVPGLRGFVGVDLVLGDREEEDTVIEVNPRPTTSYIGLRRFHAPWSVAGCWLDTAVPGAAFIEDAPHRHGRPVEF
jgi:predicted ATP-grasp superfamily ATP-dependent carboligase